MPILDKYLKPIANGKADEFHLYANVPPTYLLEQKPIKELAQSLNNEQILTLLEEVIGEEGISELNEKGVYKYIYEAEFGKFLCQMRWSDGELKTRFKLAPEPTTDPQMEAISSSLEAAASADPGRTSEQPLAPSAGVLSSDPAAYPNEAAGVGLANGVAPGQMGAPYGKPFSSSNLRYLYPNAPDIDLNLLSPLQREIVLALFENAGAEKEIDQLFEILKERKGSDLHISSGEKPIIRVDGKLQRLSHLPELSPEEIAQLIAPIMPERNRNEFVQHWDTDFAYEVEYIGRFRANIFMERRGIGAVFRMIPSRVVTAEELGLPKVLRDLCYLSKGLVLVTGPTGSGKSTTLCALIDLINRTRDDHIITIEDPIEFVHPSKRCLVNQREVGVHTDSFKSALRAALREDPDVVLVGELRDLETMSIAIETAETGHLVFGTLHTSSAVSTVDRLIDQFPPEQQQQIRLMIANSLKAVISQTLLRKKTGGRIAAMEILIVTHGVANLIRQQKIHQIQSVMQVSQHLGMQCLNDVLLDYVQKGIVDVMEAYTKAVDKINFLDMLKNAGIPLPAQLSGKDEIIE